MAATTQHGYLVLADISGYTSYLAGVELDHAHEILTDLLESIVGKFKTLLTICKLEGDAVFAYTPAVALPRGETLLELIETTYLTFCDRRDSSHRRTTCECQACQNMPNLDLKFFVHHGDYIIQQVSGIRELVGSDVNLVHRLMKNHITEATGWKAYVLFSEKSLEHLEIPSAEMHAQPETYEHLGTIPTRSYDLHARRDQFRNARREMIKPEDGDYVVVCDYPAPPPVVWDWLTDSRKRTLWTPDATWRNGSRPGGRTSAGALNHCDHGKSSTLETVLDWRPFDYFTVRTDDPSFAMIDTFYLEPTAAGTRITDVIKFLRFPFPLPRRLATPLMRLLMKKMMKYEEMLAGVAQLILEDQAAQAQAIAQ